MSKTDMTNKAGFVTGAGAGIGEGCALVLAEKGAAVMVSDIDLVAANRVADAIVASGGRAVANQCDVSDPASVAAMLRAAVEAFGAIDFAVNNAGIIGLQAPLDQYDDKTWDRVISINLTGVYHCLRAELDYFYGQGAGAIVNIASEASLRGSAADAVYTASKHGVAGLTKTTALEAVKKGVRINGVCPGSIETDLVRKFLAQNPEAAEHANNMMPIGRMGRPSEIGEAVAWLCSDAASLVAGHLLAVDGGWSAV